MQGKAMQSKAKQNMEEVGKDKKREIRRIRVIHGGNRSKNELIMRKLRELPQIDQSSLHQLFTSMATPTHPPYSSMIKKAIEDLNEENGSSEEAISEFIRKNFQDLPFAHNLILSHHLKKLVLDGELMSNPNGRFLIPHHVEEGPHQEGLNAGPHPATALRPSSPRRISQGLHKEPNPFASVPLTGSMPSERIDGIHPNSMASTSTSETKSTLNKYSRGR